MNELPYMAAFLAALLVGGVCGIRLEETTLCRTARRRRNRAAEKPRRKMTASKLIALAVLTVDGSATYIVLYLCYLAIVRDYAGALPYLTTLIGALQAVTGVVLTAYYHKAKAENCKGGITYDAALNHVSDSDTDL